MRDKHEQEEHATESPPKNAKEVGAGTLDPRTDKTSIRYVVGNGISRLSDWIDAHYQLLNGINKAVIGVSIAVLLYHSPASRKYRVTAHILPSDFKRRTKLRGVVTSIQQSHCGTAKGGKLCINLIHKPLIERLLPFLYINRDGNDTLKIRIFGVKNEPGYSVPWLHARGIVNDGSRDVTFQLLYLDETEKEKVAVCHVWHRAPTNVFVKDNLSMKMLKSGSARFNDEHPGTYACNRVKCIRDMARHLDELYRAEQTAYRKKVGMWHNRELEPRDLPSVVATAGYSLLGNIYRKLFKSPKSAIK